MFSYFTKITGILESKKKKKELKNSLIHWSASKRPQNIFMYLHECDNRNKLCDHVTIKDEYGEGEAT